MPDEVKTLNELFRAAVGRWPDKPFLFHDHSGEWSSATYGEIARRVDATARALVALGIKPGDRVGLVSENRPDWAVADLAILATGAICVPIYITLTPTQIQYIIEDSGACAIFVSGGELLAKVREVADAVPALGHVISLDPIEAPRPNERILATLQAEQADGDPVEITVGSEDLSTFIYTSGTTGPPKGVMLTHGNFTSNVLAAAQILPLGTQDRHMSFLPLCHAFERTAGHYFMMHVGAEIWYQPDVSQVVTSLPVIRPTLFVSVPRLYEKVRDAMTAKIQAAPGLKGKLARWALKVGHENSEAKLAGKPGGGLRVAIADKLVLSKLRDRFGGRVRMMCSGGAALPQSVWRFFFDIGLLILEGYGLSETSPVTNLNRPDSFRPGTVGPAVPGVEVKIASDGEVLVSGPNVMRGYHGLAEKTAEAIVDGWFHTGDIGEIDADGFLRITDRKKDIIVTSGGKNVAPQVLESLFKSDSFIGEFVVCGDGRNYLTALVVPDFTVLAPWAKERGLPEDHAALIAHPDVVALYNQRVAALSGDLARYESIKKVALIAEEFTIESGLVTPTMKVKRRVAYERFSDQIEAMYAQ